MIADVDIPGADPAAVIQQYEPYIHKIANRYIYILNRSGAVGIDDLIQVGRIAVIAAQQKYNPENGSFMNWLFYYIRSAMRRALGFNEQTGAAPVALVYLDEPITNDESLTLADTIADPDAVPMDEPIIEAETRSETAKEVRAAIDRMKSDKQRTAVSLVWLEGKTREQAAADMGMKYGSLASLEKYGRSTLRRDYRLRKYAMQMPSFRTSLGRFQQTFTSAVEAAVIWKDEHIPEYLSRKEIVAEELETRRRWTPAQDLAYMKRLRRKREEEKQSAEEEPDRISRAEQIREIWNREHAEPIR